MVSPPQQLTTWISQLFPEAVFYRPTTEKIIALTIDDIPAFHDPEDSTTQLILAALAAHNQSNPAGLRVQVTFFVLSDHLQTDSTILDQILAQGHELGNHGLTDCTHAWLSPDDFERELVTAHNRLVQISQQPIRWYRPGRGLYNATMTQSLQRLSQQNGYDIRLVLASMVPLDTFQPAHTARFTTWYVRRFIFPGAILVLHGGSRRRAENTAAVLPQLLQNLQQNGYRIVTLSELWSP